MLKQILRYAIAIILTISIIILIFTFLASSTIGNEKYVRNKLEETSYYSNIYEEVKSNFENYIYQSGLDETALENIVTEEKVRDDTNLVISNIYNGLDEKVDSTSIKENLNTNINKMLGNTKLNVTQRQAIDTLIDKLCDEYTTTILHFGSENEINVVYQKIMQYIDLAKKAMLISVAVCVILLVALTFRRIYRVFNLVSVSFISSGLFLIIVDYFINSKIKIQAITILNDSISVTIRNILTEIFGYIQRYGIILIGVGFVTMIIATLIHYFRRYKAEAETET